RSPPGGLSSRSSTRVISVRPVWDGKVLAGPSEDRLALFVLDVLPTLLDQANNPARHRYIIELLGHLAALGIGPGEELERLGGVGRLCRLLVDEDEGGACDRPGGCVGAL